MAAGPAPVVTKGTNGSWWFNIAWSVAGWAVAPKRYEVVVSGGTDNMGTSTTATVQDSGTHTIGANKSYAVTVKAFDALSGGNSSSGSTTASTKALEPPTSPSATPSYTSISLSWVKGNDNTRNTYAVKEAGSTIYSGSGFSATHSGLAPGSSHSYTITVSDSTGVTASVSIGPVTTRSYSLPGTPTFSAVGYYGFNVSWSPCTDPGITGYDVYLVYGDTSAVSNKTSGSASTSFSGLYSSTSYGVRVRGYDAAGNKTGWSSYGWTVTATVPPPPEPPWSHSPEADML